MSDSDKKKLVGYGLFLIFIVIGAVFLGFYLNDSQDGQDSNGDRNSNYSWETDSNHLSKTEKVSNITIIVDFGNGTIQEWNLNLMDHYTTPFDALNNKCDVGYDIQKLGGNSALFYVTGVNGVHEDISNNMFWLYYVNDNYATTASNAYQLEDNDVVRWVYSHPVSDQ